MSIRPWNLPDVYGAIREKLCSELHFIDDVTTRDEIERRSDLQDVEIIFSTWGMPELSREELQKYLPKLRVVFYAAGTVQKFARPFIESGVTVCSAWRANGVPVAEIAFSEIILANKGFFRRRVTCRDEWRNDDPEKAFPGNYHTRVGILGAGAIGRKVIELLKNTDVEIAVFDPFLPDEKAAELGVKKCDLADVFRTCNVISNHLANNDATRKMIGEECFSAMGKNAVFINTGRGAQVDEAALIAAMKAEPGRLALLDVTDPVEPPAEDSELYSLPNVRITPHVAGSTGYEVRRMADYMYEEYRRFIAGEPLLYVVSAKMLETMA